MTSPDVSAYVDLTLFDRTVQDVFDELVTAMQVQFPDWVPVEGHTEVVLLEAVAEGIWTLEQAANRVTAAVFEGILRMLQVVRDPGAGPVLSIRFDVADTDGHVIQAGTRLHYTSADGLIELDLTTDEDLVIAAGADTGVVTATASEPTATVNAADTGTIVLVDQLPYVDAVTVDAAITGGRDPEDNTAYLNRGSNRLSRMTTTLVRDDQFTSAALDNPAVVRAYTLHNFNSDAGSGVPGDHPGHVTVAVAGPAGAVLTAPVKAELLADLSEQALANLSIHITDSTVTAVPVTAELKRTASATDVDVVAAAETALTEFLNPDVWPYGRTVYRNDLISLLDQVDGVDVPLTVTAPAADVVPAGVAGLVTVGALNITTTL